VVWGVWVCVCRECVVECRCVGPQKRGMSTSNPERSQVRQSSGSVVPTPCVRAMSAQNARQDAQECPPYAVLVRQRRRTKCHVLVPTAYWKISCEYALLHASGSAQRSVARG